MQKFYNFSARAIISGLIAFAFSLVLMVPFVIPFSIVFTTSYFLPKYYTQGAFELWGALAGVNGQVNTFNRPNTPEFILIGNTDTAIPVSAVSVSIAGGGQQAISNQAHCQAFAKYLMEGLLGADVTIGSIWKVGTGKIANQAIDISITEVGTTGPNVYGYSDNGNGSPSTLGQQTLQANSSEAYAGFTALFITDTNLDYANVTWTDGHTDKLTVAELASLFAQTNQCDADGKLAGTLVIDNKSGSIAQVVLQTTSGGTVLVTRYDI